MKFDNFKTMCEIIGNRMCIRTHAVEEWAKNKGYTWKDMSKIIQEIKDDESKWLSEVLWKKTE